MRLRTTAGAFVAALALACAANTEGLVTLTVSELVALRAREPETAVCDANNAKTRRRFGTLPGARLLSSYRDYDPARELPADRDHPLVFYCHSEPCGAAAEAARKAIAAGYTRVAILPSGIRGWVAAGRPVERPDEG